MIDLRPFCATEPDWQYLRLPFSYGQWTYATNRHIGIRVPRRTDVPERKEAPGSKIEGLFEGALADDLSVFRPLPLYEIPKAAWKECSRCGGTRREHECPACTCVCVECAGRGRIVEASVGIGEAVVAAKYALMLMALPNPLVPTLPNAVDAMPCIFDGGHALLMPLRVRSSVHVPEPAS